MHKSFSDELFMIDALIRAHAVAQRTGTSLDEF